jgi:hypothetical protein
MKLRDLSYLFVINTTRACVFALCGLVLVVGYKLYTVKPAEVYAQEKGLPKNTHLLQTISDPGMNMDFIVSWIKTAVSNLYNFDANNYQADSRLSLLKTKFTSDGYSQYMKSLLSSKMLKFVKANIASVSAVINDAAVTNAFRFQFVTKDEWSIQVPILFSYDYKGKTPGSLLNGDRYIQTLTIKKVPAIEAPLSGVKISEVKPLKESRATS